MKAGIAPAELRAVVSIHQALTGVLEALQDCQRLARLPIRVRSQLDHLTVEVARLQGATEWIAEGIVVPVRERETPEDDPAPGDAPEGPEGE